MQTKDALDFETQTDYEVMVTATDGGDDGGANRLMATITVTINVTDVSVGDDEVDNSKPFFNDGPSTTRSVAEDTEAGEAIGDPVAAMDKERGDTLTYTLEASADAAPFAIDPMTGQLKTTTPNAGLLNYEDPDEDDNEEAKRSYTVMVTVRDSKNEDGDLALTEEADDTITVTIMVTDVNEAPMFTDGGGTRLEIATRSVPENAAPNANIGSPVTALDEDRPMQSLTYTLSGTDAASFAIVSTSGQLQTKAALDFETKTDYEVMVTATDTGGETAEIRIVITVDDDDTGTDTAVANSVPYFTVTTGDDDALRTTRSVAEDTGTGMPIGAPVEATDPEDDTLIYGLSGPDATSFAIVSTSGQLQTKAELDHETKPSYVVMVTVTDGRDADNNVDPEVDDEIRVTITVTNVNEPPFFPTTIDPIVVPEDRVSGANIGAPVVAMDVDEDDEVMYGLVDATDSFAIVEATGQLQTKDALDFETQTDYEVMVTATDGGDDGGANRLMATITVTINVTDVSVANGDDDEAVNSKPFFNDGPSTTRSVAEDTEAGEAIGDPVAAMDKERGDTLTYTLEASADAAPFAIDPMTGQLKTTTPNAGLLNYEDPDEDDNEEAKRSYTVMVTVRDSKNEDGDLALTEEADDTITVTIMVTDVNEAPMFTDGGGTRLEIATRSVPENAAPNANIGSPVTALDEDRPMQSLTYTLSGTDAASFAIVSTSGQLQTKAALDFETKTDYEVMVTATDIGGETAEIRIVITVDDDDTGTDTAVANSVPYFTVTTGDDDALRTTRSVAEDTGTGMPIGALVEATDPEDDTLIYGLSGPDATSFAIVSTSGQLQTKAELDHETKPSYVVMVTVTDGRDADNNVDPEVDDEIRVTITVTNVNEPPFFPTTIDPIVVPEDRVSGANIGAPVVAMDVDEDDEVMYGLVDATDSFAIVEATGQLQTKDALDFETQTDYEVMVTATDGGDDGGANRLMATITVTINVTDVSVANGDDDEAVNSKPFFNDGPSTTRSVAEDTEAGEAIGDPVAAMDKERGDTLTYTLEASADAAPFAIDPMTGQLKTTTPNAGLLNYEDPDEDDNEEAKRSYTVMVTVRDSKNEDGDLALTEEADDTITVTIMVTDVNEAPMFTDGGGTRLEIATRSVPENAAPNANIGSPVTALDEDRPMQSLTYTLSGTDAASFAIVSTSGQLQTKAALDFETKTDYEVMVTATDTGGETAEIRIVITVDDDDTGTDTAVANSVPYFTVTTGDDDALRTTRSVAEDTGTGMPIGALVEATDPEDDTLIYGLSGPDATSFAIVSTSGQLQTKAELDHETKPSYVVMVTVTDGRDADNNVDAAVDDEIMVTITVTNVNEPPEFAAETATRSVAEDTEAGENIDLPVAATDVDDGDTDTLTYALGDTASDALFAIVSTSGQLQTKDALDFETQTDYEVTVIATDTGDDGGANRLMATITVTINVTDVSVANGDDEVDNSAPFFNDGLRTTRSVAENTERGEAIGDPVEATDHGDTLTYMLIGTDAASFDIDTGSGQLKTMAELDYETKTSYMVMVTVTDGRDADNAVSAVNAVVDDTITVTIRVANVKEDSDLLNRPPRFLMESIDLEVLENTAKDTNIGEPILAFDADTADSLTYGFDGDDAAKFTVDDGSNTALFTFNSETGQLKTNRAIPSYEVAPGYMVMLTVKDSKDEDGESDADEEADNSIPITITVTDTSDRPAFASDETGERSVAENTPAGEDIGAPFTATAADTDGEVTYGPLRGADAASFDIDSTTGQLKTKAALDYEVVPAKTSYMVTVTATNDDAADPLSSEISVTITVTDVNEAAPAFATETATRMVDENTAAGEDIGAPVVATDVDSGDTLTYTLGGTDAASFDIDPDTGQLKTKEEFNYEVVPAKTSYMVTVTVTDGKDAESNVDTAADDTITVTITVTDVNEAPEFADETPTREVDENTVAGVDIGDPVAAMEDPDGDTLTYTLGGTDAASFDIVETSGQLQTKVALDYETQTDYEVTVTATDTGGETDTITVTINVANVSVADGDTVVENSAPVFDDGPSTTREIAENTAAGEAIGAPVVATDVDSDDTLTYTLDGTDAASFAIVETSGQLQTKVALDFETKASYMVTVTVGDGTAEDSIDVTITVTDDPSDDDTTVNNPPTFDVSSPVSYPIVAGGSGRTVGSPTATDPEGDPLTYAITSGNTARLFTIDTATGRLTTAQAVTPSSHTLTVTVRDSKNADDLPDTEVDDTITVSITVTAEGTPDTGTPDTGTPAQPGGTVTVTPPRATPGTGTTNNAPTFADGASTSREVAENTPAGQNIGSPVSATDPNGDTLTYALGGTDAASFDINTATGQLMTKVALDYETKSSYSVAVDAKDASITTSITVTINVTDVAVEDTPITDNVAPAFASETAARSIAENTAAGGAIGTPVTATDSNTGDVLTYTLGGTDMASFAINAASGQLMTQAMLDHETKASYMVMVTATDKAGLTDSITVTITVMDVNEAPMFADETATRMVDENTAADMMIGDAFMATDPDDGDEVMYSLGGDDMGSFAIDAATGQLMTMAMLDHETKASHTVMVIATDTAGLTGSIMVTISVMDVNDAPMFASATAERMVEENTAAGMMIGDPVMAMDDDGDEVMYTLGGDDMGSFAIDATTGQLMTMAALDHETKASYMVMVTASDGTDMSSITVTIMVTDVPEFMLTVPAGQSLIHIPLKMAGLAKISDLYEKLGGETKVSNLITRDAAKGRWYSYLGSQSQARVGDRDLTDDLGILAVMEGRSHHSAFRRPTWYRWG